MVSFASAVVTALACSDDGTFNTAPALSRFMLSPMKAFGLLRNSATSIWSSDTLARWLPLAMRYSVSPSLTLYSPSPLGALAGATGDARCTVPRAAGAAGRGAGAACGAAAAAPALGAVCAGVDGCGAAEICGAAGACAITGGATRDCGGSSSSVYSRTSRPDDHVSSRITSTNGSCTARSLCTRRYGRPSGRRASVTVVDDSTALYSTPDARYESAGAMRTRRLESSSELRLVMSISARRDSPSAD